MRIGFYPGSFDPFTNGHLHVVKQASKLFDKLYIGIGINSEKKRIYSQEIVKELIEKTLKREKLNNVEVVVYDGLTVSCAKQVKADYLVRGIRNGMDYQYEENIALMNETLTNIDTIYVRAGKNSFISSSFVRDLINNHMNIKNYVPIELVNYLEERK